MQITAKFASQCSTCRQPIAVGTLVEWTPGSKAAHVVCPAAQEDPRAFAHLRSAWDNDDASYESWLSHLARRPRLTVEDKGVYVMPDGQIVRMQANREGTAVYPKLWTVISGVRLTEADTREHGEFRYIEDWQERKATSQRVSAEGRKMSLEEALAFAVRYGQCARCSRHLKDATSVERGLGPVCVQYFSSEAATSEVAA